MARGYTHDEYTELLKDLHGGEFELVDRYQGSTKAVAYKHKKCGTIFLERPGVFACIEHPCPECRPRRSHKFNSNDFVLEMRAKWGDKYELINNYAGMNSPVVLKCMDCGHTFMIKASRAARAASTVVLCPKCSKYERLSQTNETLTEQVKGRFKHRFRVHWINLQYKKEKIPVCEKKYFDKLEDALNFYRLKVMDPPTRAREIELACVEHTDVFDHYLTIAVKVVIKQSCSTRDYFECVTADMMKARGNLLNASETEMLEKVLFELKAKGKGPLD